MSIATEPMNRQQWLTERKQGVGASEAAALFGVHPYISELSLYESKISDVIDEEGNERMEDGKVIEPRIVARYEKATGRKTFAPPLATYICAANPRMRATPDRFFDTQRPLELKWWDNYRKDDEIPEYGIIQLQHQLAVLAEDFGSIAILGSFRSFHYQDIERHDAFIEILHERIDRFWKRVENHDPPTADGSDATKQALKKLYPRDNGSTIFLPLDSTTWADDLEAAKIDVKKAKARVDFAANQIRGAIGDATFGVLPDGRKFSLKHQKRAAHMVAESELRVLRTAK